MRSYRFPADQDAFLDEIRDYASNKIEPIAASCDREGKLHEQTIKELAEMGLFGLTIPEEYGGMGCDPVTYGLFTEIIGRACTNTRAVFTVHTSLVAEAILECGSKAQREEHLPDMAAGRKFAAFALSEPNIGSDAKHIETQYREQGDEYVINGTKKWITLGTYADMFLVIAQNGETASAFLVDRTSPGVSVKPVEGLLGCRGCHVGYVQFEDVRVPKARMLGTPGAGFTFVASVALDHGRYSVAWGSVGLAQAALDAMVLYARQRKQFGKILYSFQLIKEMIGNAVTKTHAARALCRRAGELRLEQDADAVFETTMAKYFASQVCTAVTSDAVQLHGANGLVAAYPVERYFREAKIMEIIEGSSQMQQLMIAKYGMNTYGMP